VIEYEASDKQIDLTIPPSLPAGADGPKSSTDRCSLTERARIELNSPSTQSREIESTRRASRRKFTRQSGRGKDGARERARARPTSAAFGPRFFHSAGKRENEAGRVVGHSEPPE
jgi:hypothetical protein